MVSKTIDPNLLTPEIQIDAPLDFESISPRFYRIIRQFAPFGPGNMTPVFMSENLRDTGFAKCVGEDGKHLKINAFQGNQKISGIGFNLGHKLDLVENRNPFNAVYSIDENHWQGNVSLQLKLRDIK